MPVMRIVYRADSRAFNPLGRNDFHDIDLDEAEEAVLSSAGNADLTQLFLNMNIPTHTTFAAIYLVSFFLLLWHGMKAKKYREQ